LGSCIGIVSKTISNYINHLAETPMKEKYSQFSWAKVQKQ
jgi:hypothetical protein